MKAKYFQPVVKSFGQTQYTTFVIN